MKKVVLLRHGESTWNRENRFTGWTDVDLSEKGVAEAARAGGLLRKEGFLFGHAYTSYLKRAVKTLDVVLDKLDLPADKEPDMAAWISMVEKIKHPSKTIEIALVGKYTELPDAYKSI